MSTRPIPEDPSGPTVEAMLDIRGQDWWLTQPGDVKTAAVETMLVDGSQFQRMIAIEIQVRRNHDRKTETLRVMIHPESALLLAKNLAHTDRWLRSLDRRNRIPPKWR